jgi:DNA-binding NarL/FixJ family response regulator
VIFLTVRDSVLHLRRLILSGAKTVLSKSVDVQVLVDAIKEVYHNEFFYYGMLTRDFMDEIFNTPEIKCSILQGDGLTKREMEVIILICEGKSNGEISMELSLSQRTVENHRMRISKKAGCKTTAELVIFAIRNGIYEI